MLKKIALNIICQRKYTMPYSTLFWSIYTISICSLMQNTEILYLSELKKSKYNLSEEIYNALLYSVLEYIHQLNMLSHVKYRNSNVTRMEKNLIDILAPQS